MATNSSQSILIKNAHVFDGKGGPLSGPLSVLVEDNKIAKIDKSIDAPAGASVLDAAGRTMTPGFIGSHEHLVGQVPFNELTNDTRYMAYAATKTVRTYLMKGFTTVFGGRPLKGESGMTSDYTEQDGGAMEARFNEAHQGIMSMLFAAYKMRGRKLRAPDGSLPLTIIGGFLGSGKTTLLNRLLIAPHGRRLVVLVNDFGRINIDASLVASHTDDMITLTNGCACCAVSADLTNSLIEIAEREDPPDAIVLEARGIADPYGIEHVARSNPSIRLDGSLVVLDAETMHELAGDPLTSRLFHNQISAADLIVLSKVDLLNGGQVAASREWLAEHYPDKRVIEAVFGDVPVEIVLGLDTRRKPGANTSEPKEHAHNFESVSFTFDEPIDGDRLHVVFDALPEELLRAKGVLNLAEEPKRRTIYQRVGKRWSYTAAEPWGKVRPHSSLVFIGPVGLLDAPTLEARFGACRANRRDEAGAA